MAPTIKNAKPKGVINFTGNWMDRVPATTDAAADFYQKSNCSFHGWVYLNPPSDISYNSTKGIIFAAGPYNEITLQKIGNGTVLVEGSLVNDKNYLVTCNLVTSADGLIRIQSQYKFICISASSLNTTSALYLQIW